MPTSAGKASTEIMLLGCPLGNTQSDTPQNERAAEGVLQPIATVAPRLPAIAGRGTVSREFFRARREMQASSITRW